MREIGLEPLDGRHLDDVPELAADPEGLRYTRIPESPLESFATTWIVPGQHG